jgi:hypothetical protein
MIGVDCPGVYEYVYRCAVHVYGAIVERAASGTAARAQRHGFTEHLRGGRRLDLHSGPAAFLLCAPTIMPALPSASVE